MTNTKIKDQDESLVHNVHALEGMVARQDDMIKDLVRLIRMQNSEINAIMQQQNKQGSEHERQQRRMSGIVDKLNSRLCSFLDEATATDTNKKEGPGKESSDPSLISCLMAKVDVLDSMLRDHQQSQQETLQRQIDALENKIDSLQNQMPSNNRSNEEIKGLNTEDLQSLTEAIAKGQTSMQSQIENLADTLNRKIDIISGQKPDVQFQEGKVRMSQKSFGHKSKTSKDMPIKFETNSIESPQPVRSIRIDGDIHSFSSLDLPSVHTPSQISDSRSMEKEYQNEDIDFPDNYYHQVTSPNSTTGQKDMSKPTQQTLQNKDILNLKIRLAYAEKLIGARYRTGTFTIRGRSFFQDATALRYIATDQHARDAFKMFYGNRLHAINYVDVAPPAVLAAFDIVSRIRCRHEMWTDDKLEAKRQIRCASENIVDDWIKSLPLSESDEYSLDISAHKVQKQFNILKVLCYRNYVEFDFVLPAV
jgi:hypothetical protein